MAWTQSDIDKLKRALASGARRVRFADREVEYRSLEEMREIIAQAERDVKGPQRTTGLVRLTGGSGGW